VAILLSVKRKILLSLWLTTFLLVVLSGSAASIWFVQDQAGRIDDFLTKNIRSVQETLETYFTVNSGEGAIFDSVSTAEFRVFLDKFLQERLNSQVSYKTTLGIYDPQGVRVQASNLALDLAVPDLPTNKDFLLGTVRHNPPFRVAIVPLVHAGQVLGTVRLACVTSTLDEVWKSFIFSLSLVLGPVFLAFGVLGTVLINWSMRPVRELSLSAQNISESHLNLRLAVPPGRDEVSQMASTLNNLLAKLEQDFQFEEALVGQLSHELRTPLTILRGRNEVTLGQLPASTGTVQRLLEDNLADIDNIVNLLNTLLNLARLDSGHDRPPLKPCDLKGILADLIEELEPLWDEKALGFHYFLPGETSSWAQCPPLESQGDPTLLHQVFLNVLTNAFKYAPRASRIHLTIENAGTAEGPLWRVVFRNEGPPIPEESLELIFKRFYRVESQDPDRIERASGMGQKGFGLGLSLAKAMLSLQDGRIRAFNPSQGGAAFEILLHRTTHPRTRTNKRSSE
jgi:signal transduction histidine kinase